MVCIQIIENNIKGRIYYLGSRKSRLVPRLYRKNTKRSLLLYTSSQVFENEKKFFYFLYF